MIGTYIKLHSVYFVYRLRQYGSLHASTRPHQTRRQEENTVNTVKRELLNNPHTSTRAIGHDLHIDNIKVHRIIKQNLKWHPFKRHSTQRLFPADFGRRRAFCNWMLDQVSEKTQE